MHESPVWLLSHGKMDKYERSSNFFAGKRNPSRKQKQSTASQAPFFPADEYSLGLTEVNF